MALPFAPDLNSYLEQTQVLLDDQTAALYNVGDLTNFVNIARGQLAADTECLRQPATIHTVNGQQGYRWATAASFVGDPDVVAGIGGILNIRMINLQVGAGPTANRMVYRPFEFFNYYFSPLGNSGTPQQWTTLQQGLNGNILLHPIPDNVYVLLIDPVCYPATLGPTDFTDPEALPWPYTDAVPYYAAYLAYLSKQRQEDAARMLMQYQMFARRGRQEVTPTVLPAYYPGGQGARLAMDRTNIATGIEQAAPRNQTGG